MTLYNPQYVWGIQLCENINILLSLTNTFSSKNSPSTSTTFHSIWCSGDYHCCTVFLFTLSSKLGVNLIFFDDKCFTKQHFFDQQQTHKESESEENFLISPLEDEKCRRFKKKDTVVWQTLGIFHCMLEHTLSICKAKMAINGIDNSIW